MHAWHVARKLGDQRVVCPPGAGAGSTIGMLMAPARVDRVASFNVALAGADFAAAARVFAGLEKESVEVLRLTGADIEQRTVRRLADMRYIGQGSEVTVALPDPITEAGVRTAFEAAYKALFARTPPGAAIQFVALRLSASAPMPGSGGALELPRHPSATALKGTRPVYFPDAGKMLPTPGVGPLRARARRQHRRPRRVRGGREHVHRRSRRQGAPAGRRLHPGGGRADGVAPFDPIELELLWRRLISMVDEAAAAMVRTSFSTLVRESYDFSCVITDAAGQSLVQASESIPSFIGTLPETVKHFLRFFPPDQLAPGDVLITNDIWLGTGHLPDITLAKPIFRDGRLVAFSATTAHAPDIGGKIRSPEPREVFEEGLQIPPMKMIAAGKTDETLVTIIRKNVRTPDQTMGDLWAQVVALDLMEDRLRNLMEGYGLPDLTDLAREIQGRCETAMRAAIRELPDGTYQQRAQDRRPDGHADHAQDGAHHQGRRDRDGFRRHRRPGRSRHQLRALLHQRHGDVRGEGLHQPQPAQQRGRVAADHAQGAGGLHRQSAIPRAGRLAHADRPLRADAGVRLPGPDRAGARDGGLRLADVGHEPVGRARRRQGGGKPYANMFFYNGGMGGNTRRDGVTCLSWPSNVSSTSIEISEHIAPLRFHHKKLRPDSGGPGRHRGGLGQEILIESRSDTPIAVSFLAERTLFPAFGIEGGQDGAPGELRINGTKTDPKKQYVVNKGDTVSLGTPGGGGHGDPGQRDAAALAADIDSPAT